MINWKSVVVCAVLVTVHWKHISAEIIVLFEKNMSISSIARKLNITSLQVIPERAGVKYINEKYIYNNGTINVRRYGRNSGYYINFGGTTKMEFGNNVSLHLIFFEFLHNEYKRSFVEMKFEKICDSINKDPYVGRAIKMTGMPCPLPPGHHKVMNITVPTQDFPNVWPFEKCKIEATLLQNQNKDILAIVDIFVLFKQKPRKT